MRQFILIFLALLLTLVTNGQTGNVFWFAAPDVSALHGGAMNNGKPIRLHVTAEFNTTVTISRPADPTFVPIVYNLAAQQHQMTRLDGAAPLLNISAIEVTASDPSNIAFIQPKGFLIQAFPGEVTAYYELDSDWNRDIFALKSKNALGTEFFVSTQNLWPNGYSDAFSGFTVVATEDNTVVNVYPNGNNLAFVGSPAVVTVTLNRGETFAMTSVNQLAINHLQGVKITSTKKIAVTIYDDSVSKRFADPGSFSRDIIGDQTIPTPLIGNNYIAMKGNLFQSAIDGNERVFFTATQPNTHITITPSNSAPPPIITIPAIGGGANYEIRTPNRWVYIHSDKPIYVVHVSGTGGGGELGGPVLPTIDGCTGSHTVTITRNNLGGDMFWVNLMARNDTLDGSPAKNQTISNFSINITRGALALPALSFPANSFEYTPDSTWVILNSTGRTFLQSRIQPNDVIRFDNYLSRFHLGVQNGALSNGNKYGYFSDYSSNQGNAGIGGSEAGRMGIYCSLDPIQLVAAGGRTYSWSCTSNPIYTANLSSTTVAAPWFDPDTVGIYKFRVVITGECYSSRNVDITIIVSKTSMADFSILSDVGCSPFTAQITNLSDTITGIMQNWVVEDAAENALYDHTFTEFYPMNFNYALPNNNTDSIQQYSVRFIVKGAANSCPSEKVKIVKVKPNVTAGFSASDSIGCHPLDVQFTNLSTGHVDSTSYTWDFGDNSQSFETNPAKTFDNYTLDDTVYNVKLLVESPLGCTDSAKKQMTVHPRVRAKFVVDTSSSCTPLNVNLDPSSSYGADTLWWNIDYWYADSSYRTTSITPIHLTHYDTSTVAGPDTLWVQMIAGNRMGCHDTAATRRLIAYPEVIADFAVSDDDICDSIPITIDNNSIGYNLFYEWDWGNSNFNNDLTGQSYTKRYFNRSDADTVYTIFLRATSGYFCEDTMSIPITVHPYVSADFGLNFDNNCSPLYTIISNTSIRAHHNYWDFGGGQFENNTVFWDTTFVNHDPVNDTTYTIKLRTSNNEGCSDSLTRTLLIYPEVVADFSMSDDLGCSPYDVTFTNLSRGGNLLFTWTFGDNVSATSTSASPPAYIKNYTNYTDHDTSYYIRLNAKNSVGCDSSWYDTVKVLAYIDSYFMIPVVDSCSPFTIRPFNLSSIGSKEFRWTVNNGVADIFTSSAYNPNVGVLNNTGTTDQNLTVQLITFGANDADHLACADTHRIPIIVYPEMNADFALDNYADCQPLVANFTNNSNILTGSRFDWYVDGNFYSQAQIPFALTVSNLTNFNTNHTVDLYARTIHDCRDTISRPFTVYSLVDAYFTVDRPGICSGDSFLVDRTFTRGGITGYKWDFNAEETNTSSQVNFYHSFDNLSGGVPLNKYVTLTVNNFEGCDSIWKQTIAVYPKVTADFDVDDYDVCYPHKSVFTNNTTYADEYFWSYGDGASSTEDSPFHYYMNFSNTVDNIHSIQLKARSNFNCFDSIRKDITIYAKPNADFSFPKAVDCPPFEAFMDNHSEGSALTYFWDFDGDGTSTDFEPSHTFSNNTSVIRPYPITLAVTSDKNCYDTLIKEVNVYPNVTVAFTASTNFGCSPLNVQFTGNTTNVSTMSWYLDGTLISTNINPTYRFNNERPDNDVHTIRFVGQSLYDCKDTTEQTITVYPTPSAEFLSRPLPADYGTQLDQTPITFDNQTLFQDNWIYEWNYGDGTIDNKPDEIFTYTYPAFFWGKPAYNNRVMVQLVAWNEDNTECRDTTFHEIIIYPPIPQVDLAEDIAHCVPYDVDFTATTKYIYDTSLVWDFGDGTYSKEAEPSHSYNTAGVYTVTLRVQGDGGSNHDYKIVEVYPQPIADFSFNDSIVFDSSQTKGYDWINFYNHTKYANSYEWYFDADNRYADGNPDSKDKEPSWHYNDIGVYHIGLIATSGEGCVDSLIHPKVIRVLGEGYVYFPNAFFVTPDGPWDEYDTKREDNKMVFYPRNQGVDEYKLEIYNRWGVLVFKSDDVNHGWNGYIEGKPGKQDVYIWRVRGRFTNGQPYDKSGDVTLIHGRVEAIP